MLAHGVGAIVVPGKEEVMDDLRERVVHEIAYMDSDEVDRLKSFYQLCYECADRILALVDAEYRMALEERNEARALARLHTDYGGSHICGNCPICLAMARWERGRL